MTSRRDIGSAITRRAFTSGLATLWACGGGGNGVSGGKLAQATRDFLLAATTFELVAVHPDWSLTPDAMPEGVTEIMHQHGVLGRAKVEAADERTEMANLIDEAIGSGGNGAAACFNPRHAVSASQGDRRIDILICFECAALQVWEGDAAKPVSYVIGHAGDSRMNEIFRGHGLKLFPKRE